MLSYKCGGKVNITKNLVVVLKIEMEGKRLAKYLFPLINVLIFFRFFFFLTYW